MNKNISYTIFPGLYKKYDIDFNKVKLFICEEFGITLEELHKSTRSTKYSNPRMMCIYIGSYIYNLTYKELLLDFGLKSNGTIKNAKEKVGNWLETDSKILDKYLNVLGKMEQYGNFRREQGLPHIWDAYCHSFDIKRTK